MQLSNLPKILLILTFSVVVFQGCGGNKPADIDSGPPADAQKAEPPYANAEPEKYQTEIVVTSGAVVENFMVVRNGGKWRVDTAFGEPKQVTTIRTDKDYVLSIASKSFAEYQSGHGYEERAQMVEDITHGMINSRTNAVFEKLDTAGGVTKYRKWGEAGKNLVSIVSFDEKAGIPVKMEIFKTTPGTGPADITVQLVNFKLEPDETLLAIPKDFKEIPIQDMKKILIAAP